MRFSIHTLGCRANQADSERLAEILKSAGFDEVPFGQPADCQIVNTCTITREADRKSAQMIRRAERLAETGVAGQVVATGCAVATRGGLSSRLPGSVLRLPPEERENILERLQAQNCPSSENLDNTLKRKRALLRVQDGCDQFCTFCIVPYVRGRARSQPIAWVVEQVGQLRHQELVLTGIHLSAYEDGERNLADLVETLLAEFPGLRIRLSSLEPDLFPERILDLMAREPRLCPHLHLVLQHASDRLLEKMHRGYTLAQYDRLVQRFMQEVPGACLTTDLMVGFPGETEQDFQELMDYVRRTPFYHIHVFPYSQRPGTAAAKFTDQVRPEVQKDRRDRLLRLAERKRVEYLRSCKGQEREVVAESVIRPGWLEGTADNYLTVQFRGTPRDLGHTRRVRLVRRSGGVMVGTCLG